MAHLGRVPESIHCKDKDLMKCADHLHDALRGQFISADNVLLVGLQPRFLEQLAAIKTVRVCDLNPDVIGTIRSGVVIDGPDRFSENAAWAGAIFATGSTVVNGTIDEILDAGRDTFFYGVTVTGVASLLGLKQFCHVIEQAKSSHCLAHEQSHIPQ